MRGGLIILLYLYYLPVIFGGEEKNDTVFVPTREWQVVKKGTPIPEGLHIRHNFQTGVTEAKLMDEEEEKNSDEKLSDTKSLTLHPDKDVLNSEDDDSSDIIKKHEKLKYSIDELKARLKKIKQDANQEQEEESSDSNDEDAKTKVKQKFRDYETLKKELKALETNITTDSELLTNYFEKFLPHKSGIIMGTLTIPEIEEVLDILYNLEYLLHHIDNAKVFTDMQGMSKIISPCLNGTNNEIKAEALRLLGAAVQSNPKVQIKALENDFVQKLLHILSTNSKIEVKSRCLFALSALIRQFPAAQKVWIDHGGLEIFGKILVGDQLQVQIKVMKLINDLITERQNLQEITDAEHRERKTKAYAMADIEKKLLVHKYCKHLSNLMTKSFNEEISNELGTENYEFLETVSESMITVTPVCKSVFGDNKNLLLPIIHHLLTFYQNSGLSKEQDESDILQNLTLLITKLHTTVSEIVHDEL